ncbi:hypothetical protein BSLG_008870 [Batrachochytrium salamandrivorans]|nr:hypothetical protein BSLG_008870 [Batrachochytrium salamandrivorans]
MLDCGESSIATSPANKKNKKKTSDEADVKVKSDTHTKKPTVSLPAPKNVLEATKEPSTDDNCTVPVANISQPANLLNTLSNSSTASSNWEKAPLDGDTARKEKFMRLLGAKKAGVSDSSLAVKDDTTTGPKLAQDSNVAQADLLKQFEKSKDIQQTRKQGKRFGLGF